MCYDPDRKEAHDCYRGSVRVNERDYTVTHCTDEPNEVTVEADGIGVNGDGKVIGRWDGCVFDIDTSLLAPDVKQAVQRQLVIAKRC